MEGTYFTYFKRISSRRPTQVLILTILAGLGIRLYLAPYSTGSDIPQFYGFAGTMIRHPFDFYSYATGNHWETEGWPYGWPYVYGPVLAYLLALVRLIVGGEREILLGFPGLPRLRIEIMDYGC